MKKTVLICITLVLLLTGISVVQSHAQFEQTSSRTVTLFPGQQFTHILGFRNVLTTETYTIQVIEDYGSTFRFWVMHSTEYDEWQSNSSYIPVTFVNISINAYYDNNVTFPEDGTYVYGVKNEGLGTIYVTVKFTRPSAIDGFTMFWVAFGVLVSVLMFFSYRHVSKRNLSARFSSQFI